MPIIDTQVLETMTSGDEELLADISILLAKEFPQVKARLNYGIENNEFAEIENVAHQMRGRACYFGATHLQESARQLETAAKDHEAEKFSKLSHEIISGLEELLDELRGMTGLALEIESD